MRRVGLGLGFIWGSRWTLVGPIGPDRCLPSPGKNMSLLYYIYFILFNKTVANMFRQIKIRTDRGLTFEIERGIFRKQSMAFRK